MKTLTPEAITCLATSFANELASNHSIEEIAVIKNVASQVVAVLNTILSQRLFLECEKNKYKK